MTYRMDDVTNRDKDAVARWASHPEFFYVYINSGISKDDIEKSAKAGADYVDGCDKALQGRKAALKLSEFQGDLSTRLREKGISEIYNLAVKLKTDWDSVWTKGLRDENDKLCGLTVLMHEKKTGKTEIGYMLDPDYFGKGVATPMVMSALNWARQNTDLQVLKADVDPKNVKSIGILNKLGLEQVGKDNPEGKYKNPDGSAIASRIMEGGADKIDAAIQAHLAKGGALFHVSDAVLDAKVGRTIGVNLDGVEHDEHRM